MRVRAVITLIVAVCAATPGSLHACNVPVFRYAMERWPADPYRIVVYHAAEPEPAAIGILEKSVAERGGAANYSLTRIDVARPEGKAAAGRRNLSAFPWVEIYYPAPSAIRAPVWSGPLTIDRARSIVHSPSRIRLAQQLLGGDVAVWILVQSGHEQKDRRAWEALETALERAAATLRIPDTGVDENGNAVEVADFKTYPVRFGMMSISRADPREDVLLRALLQSEPDLARYDEPLAFPVFGRGRALYALVGDGIQEKNIHEACQSLLGWCSCEIKAQNPGTDLLMAADWSRPFGGRMVKDPELPLTGISGFLEKEPAPAPPPAARSEPQSAVTAAMCIREPARGAADAIPAAPAELPAPERSPLMRNILYLGGAAGVALLGLSLFLTVRARR